MQMTDGWKKQQRIEIGCAMSSARKKAGISQAGLSERISNATGLIVSQQNVNSWEHGNFPEDNDICKIISDILNIEYAEMVSGQKEMERLAEKGGGNIRNGLNFVYESLPPGIVNMYDEPRLESLFPEKDEFMYMIEKWTGCSDPAGKVWGRESWQKRLSGVCCLEHKMALAKEYGHGQEFWDDHRMYLTELSEIPENMFGLGDALFTHYINAYLRDRIGTRMSLESVLDTVRAIVLKTDSCECEIVNKWQRREHGPMQINGGSGMAYKVYYERSDANAGSNHYVKALLDNVFMIALEDESGTRLLPEEWSVLIPDQGARYKVQLSLTETGEALYAWKESAEKEKTRILSEMR